MKCYIHSFYGYGIWTCDYSNSNAQAWEDIEQSIDLALTCTIDIIVTGDFNVNMLRNTSNDKFLIVIIRFGIALPASFISICTIERVIESISSNANKLSKLTCESCSR
jgi:hypothetical protein